MKGRPPLDLVMPARGLVVFDQVRFSSTLVNTALKLVLISIRYKSAPCHLSFTMNSLIFMYLDLLYYLIIITLCRCSWSTLTVFLSRYTEERDKLVIGKVKIFRTLCCHLVPNNLVLNSKNPTVYHKIPDLRHTTYLVNFPILVSN